jgi:hypothetical protein
LSITLFFKVLKCVGQRSILELNTHRDCECTKEEAIAIAKYRIQDRAAEVDEENICQIEDEDLLKEIEEDERKADEEEAKATAKKKNKWKKGSGHFLTYSSLTKERPYFPKRRRVILTAC